jgi:hypothetical protein
MTGMKKLAAFAIIVVVSFVGFSGPASAFRICIPGPVRVCYSTDSDPTEPDRPTDTDGPTKTPKEELKEEPGDPEAGCDPKDQCPEVDFRR